ncbi:hypothetical protein J2754_001359 [Halarchaeum solikamskense]|nr:hypothetical protein [Halarchaeum solikamskense]
MGLWDAGRVVCQLRRRTAEAVALLVEGRGHRLAFGRPDRSIDAIRPVVTLGHSRTKRSVER